MLNGTEQLGNSTKNSLSFLFNDIIEKIYKKINNSLENEINFYTDIFYRENKNILSKFFIDYYYQDKNEYEIDIYQLKNYLGELILDKNFNKTLNNYSSLLIKYIRDEIELKVKQYINNKIQILSEELNIISINITNIISSKEIIDINEDMLPIYYLNQNFSIIIKNHDDHYKFKIGEEPFQLITSFIDEDIRPPLIIIKEKYNYIEEQILEVITSISDNFPDCYSIVRDNFINNRIEDIYNYITEINETILEYKDLLNEDIESYINKLSYHSFINGLYTYENECNESYCMFNRTNRNKIRKLNLKIDNHINDNDYNYHFYKNTNTTKNSKRNNWKKNRNLFFKRKLYEYDSSDPGLSKDDVLPYIEDIIKAILDFDKIYLSQDFRYINTSVNKYLIKINGTCLDNLKRSFSIKLEKFSTLITEEKMKILKDKIMVQYYQIEPFIHERSNFIFDLINNFTRAVNNTKNLNKLISLHTKQKLNLYFDTLTDNIQSKYKVIKFIDLNIDKQNEYIIRDWSFFTGSAKELEGQLTIVDKYLFDLEDKVVSFAKDVFGFGGNKNGSESFLSSLIKSFDFMKGILDYFDRDFYSYKYEIRIPLHVFPCLYLIITNYITLGSRLEINPILDDTIGLSIDLSVRGEIGVSMDVGIYIPDPDSPFLISVVAGMKGILASGRIGIRLNLFLVAEKYETDLYFIFNAFGFEFYVKFEIKFRIWRISYSYQYYLIKQKYYLFSVEKHKKKLHDMKFFNLKAQILLQNKIKDIDYLLK